MASDTLGESEKAQARKAYESYDEFLTYYDLGGAGASLALSLLVPPAGPFMGAGAALLAFLVRKKRKTAKRMADDPADPNFRIPVRVRPLRLDLEWFGHEGVGYNFARAARDLSSSEAELRAFLTALERSAGAREAGDREYYEVRLLEAITHAQLTGRFMGESEESLKDLSVALRTALPPADEGTSAGREPKEGEALLDLWSDDTLALLFRVGVSKRDVDRPVPHPLPRRRLQSLRDEYPAQLEEVASATGELGRTLTSWAEQARPDGPDQSSSGGSIRW
jgi:hypothetical protein